MAESTAVADGAVRPGRVLVVDDDPDFLDYMGHELSSLGYGVLLAAGGGEGLRKGRGAGDVEVAIVDLNMPGQGGLDLLKDLKALPAAPEVIMATAHATIRDAVESMKRGAYDFVVKPVDAGEVRRLLERAREKRRLALMVDKLRQISDAKSEFLATMSHELRTPLAAILGYTSLFLEKIYGDISPRQEEILKRVECAGQTLLRLINDVLDMSKIAAGKMTVSRGEFSLRDLVKEVAGMLEGLAEKKRIRLSWRASGLLPMTSDRNKVRQIILNLTANAIEFTSEGEVSIRAEQAKGPPGIRVRVQDTGTGIRSEDMPLLFEEFRQLDGSLTREHHGTGLGLALSRKLAGLLGGSIEVESAWGKGSAFTVALPSRSPEGAA